MDSIINTYYHLTEQVPASLENLEVVQPMPLEKKRMPRLILDNMGNILEIYLDSSLLKKFYFKGNKREICPKKKYEVELMRSVIVPPSERMNMGNYFEYLCIGDTADGKVPIMEPIRGGKKGIDQERIEAQAMVFKQLAEEYGIIIKKEDDEHGKKNTQIRHKIALDDYEGIKVWLTMIFDLVTPLVLPHISYDSVIIDLKLTGNLSSTFGEYCWGSPENMDHMQGFIYGFTTGLPFYYWVFENNKLMRNQLISLNTNINHEDRIRAAEARVRYSEMMNTINGVLADIMTYHMLGWHTEPYYHECKDCPLTNCPDKMKGKEI